MAEATIDYAAVLADLRDRRAQMDRAITAIESLIGTQPRARLTGSLGERVLALMADGETWRAIALRDALTETGYRTINNTEISRANLDNTLSHLVDSKAVDRVARGRYRAAASPEGR